MLDSLVRNTVEKISALKSYVALCETCDEARASTESALRKELEAKAALTILPQEERIFRHCTIVTRLYGIFEYFCENTVTQWLARYPKYQKFSQLPAELKNSYRIGVCHVLSKITAKKYSNLNVQIILEKYLCCLKDESPWEFLSEAFTTHERNLRRPEIEHMFDSSGLVGLWAWIERDHRVSDFLSSDGETILLADWISDFVDFRNRASHGSTDEILGLNTLSDWIDFIGAVCSAISAFLFHHIIREELRINSSLPCGIITETFSQDRAVMTCSQGKFRVGDTLYFWRATDLITGSIESLRVNNIPTEEVSVETTDFEIGIKLGGLEKKIKRGAQVITSSDFRSI